MIPSNLDLAISRLLRRKARLEKQLQIHSLQGNSLLSDAGNRHRTAQLQKHIANTGQRANRVLRHLSERGESPIAALAASPHIPSSLAPYVVKYLAKYAAKAHAETVTGAAS